MTQASSDFKDEFAEYLSNPRWGFNWYVTQTFDSQKVNPYSRICEHSWRFFNNQLALTSSAHWGWMFAERGKGNGRLHWHALMHVEKNLFDQPERGEIWSAMHKKYGRNLILEYSPGDQRILRDCKFVATGVSCYLTKYVAKEANGGDATWDFMGFLSGKEAATKELHAIIGVDGGGS